MAITYPIDLPISGVSEITWRALSTNFYNEGLFGGTQSVARTDFMNWSIDIHLPPMTGDKAEQWISFLLSLKGRLGTFKIYPYLYGSAKRGCSRVGGLVNGAVSTGSSIVTDGWRANAENLFKAGDFITISSKLYKVLQDVDSDSSGNATIDLWPNIISSIADNTSIEVDEPFGLFRLIDDSMTYDINVASHYGLSFSARGVL